MPITESGILSVSPGRRQDACVCHRIQNPFAYVYVIKQISSLYFSIFPFSVVPLS
jgi:hypothetical protein